MSEAYNECFRLSTGTHYLKLFLEKNPIVGQHFLKKKKTNYRNQIVDDVDLMEGDDDVNSMFEMCKKSLSTTKTNWWIHEELLDRKLVGKVLFGPKIDKTKKLISYRESVYEFLEKVDEWRINETYKHTECTEDCVKRGCGHVWSMDGLWKLAYPICMAVVEGEVSDD